MHCELVIPQLFSAHPQGRYPALELLLARGRRHGGETQTLEQWLQEAFELGDGAFPAGALTLLGCGIDPLDAWCMRADPVHLRVMRDHLVRADDFSIAREEADALCAALGRHFARLEFTACEPRRWVVRSPEPLENADPLVNEIQMLLHADPMNEAREARGEPAINSVWLWGPGRKPREASCAWQSVAADEPAALGAARLAGARHRPLPRSAEDWLGRLPDDGRHLALLEAIPIEKLEALWFAPLLAALRAGRVGMVTVHVPDGGFSCETIRGDLRRFWRVARSIERYA